MYNFFFKMALMLVMINIGFAVIWGSSYTSVMTGKNVLTFVPTSILNGTDTTSSTSAKNPFINDNASTTGSIEAGTGQSPNGLDVYGQFLGTATSVIGFVNIIAFGYIAWIGILLPGDALAPIRLLIIVPLFFFQMIGSFFILQFVAQTAGFIFGLFKGVA